MKIEEYIVKLGKELGDEMIKCSSMDLCAADLAKSDDPDDLNRAKLILEEIKSMSEKYYTKKTYEKVLQKLKD